MPSSETNGSSHNAMDVHMNTPTKQRHTNVNIDANSLSSPSSARRGILRSGAKNKAHTSISPRSRSSGRSESRSPRKRNSKLELEQIYDEQDDLEEAERIINESRNEVAHEKDDHEAAKHPKEYKDFNFEEDLADDRGKEYSSNEDDDENDEHKNDVNDENDDNDSEESPSSGPGIRRRPRRAARKALEAARKAYSDDYMDSSEEAEVNSSEASEDSNMSEVDESSDDPSVDAESDDDVVYQEPIKNKRGRPPKRRRESAEESETDMMEASLAAKRRVGRPSKKIIEAKIKSIFEQDDEMLGVEKSPLKPIAGSIASPQSRKADTDIWAEFDKIKTEEDKTPLVISGMENTESETKKDPKKFVPFPEPKVNANGKIDPEYLRKHLPNIDFEARGADLMDDRSFFMEGTEGYFEQHSMRPKLGRSSLASLAPNVDYSDFILYNKLPPLIKQSAIKQLEEMHKALYHQWCFELSEGYSINFFGFGSKRQIIIDFVQNYLLEWIACHYETEETEEIEAFIVNGYNPNTQLKQLVYQIQSLLVPKDVQKKLKFSKHIFETIPLMLKYLGSVRSDKVAPRVVVAIHNVDGPAFSDEKTQSLLSQLASLPEIWLITSTDNINASLLWDSFKLKNFNFVWHDLTTYQPYTVELSFKDLLNTGKSSKFVGTRGAKYVLSSLTANARNLYRTLLELQIGNLVKNAASEAAKANLKGNLKLAVGFKQLYDACSEQFITSNEISFRTMLGEFVEHKMCNLKKNASGGEVVFVPFSYDEMRKLLSEEFSVSID
ncbi:Origin recognition complex subunit 2 [Meyerozyma sp. JA9]|nr:Origin recognition complex subunit 2 [Meyerozyma sp. JA9]